MLDGNMVIDETRRDRVVVENTQPLVKTKSKLTNFKNKSQIEGYNDK